MPAINITNNTDIDLSAASNIDTATLNRYLQGAIGFRTAPAFDAAANLLVRDQKEADFPTTLAAAGEAKFAVGKTSLDIQLGASASVGLLRGGNEFDFLSSVNLAGDPASSGLVSFAVKGTLAAADSATPADFCFGIAGNAALTLTSYYAAAANDKLGDAIIRAAAGLTIPHRIDDLESLPAGAICRVDAVSSLKFTASLAYSFLNDPLAAAAIAKLPSLDIGATASATIEGTATHTSGHTLTIARLPNGLLHLSVSLTGTDDLETSLTVSAGVAADIGGQDALGFLLDRINPGSAAEADAVAAQMADPGQFKADIKSAIEKALSSSLGASLKAALERCAVRNRAFVYEVDLNSLDEASQAALQAALAGDFTGVTRPGAQLAGIRPLDSTISVAVTGTHTLALHFLGIFNAASIHQFIAKSKVDYTSDTHEIVFSNESLQVVDDNLDAEKLRKLVLKDITLTLPASANTPDAKTPIALTFFDREAAAGQSKMRQYANVLQAVGASSAVAAQALLGRNLKNYGVCSLFLGLSLDAGQCRRLFIGSHNQPYAWESYIVAFCAAEEAILANDAENAYRLPLFGADLGVWNALRDAGDAPNMTPILRGLGMADAEAQLAVTDALTAIWWAEAMARYATALARGQSLEAAGRNIAQDSNRGYNEPWMILAAWNLAGMPEIQTLFTAPLLEAVSAAH